jgi:hypothetical protein
MRSTLSIYLRILHSFDIKLRSTIRSNSHSATFCPNSIHSHEEYLLWMLRHVAFVTTDISEESIASIIRKTVFLHSVLRLLVSANVASGSPILFTLMLVEIRPSEISVPSRVTRRNIPEDGILHSHRRENLGAYIALIG